MAHILSGVSGNSVIIMIILVVFSKHSAAQVVSTGHSRVEKTEYVTEYPDTAIRDNIYIYCDVNGDLSASLPGTPGDLLFEWSVYDPGAGSFEPPFKTETGAESGITDLPSGGYKVRVSDGNGLDTLFLAWVFVNQPALTVEVLRHDCQVLDLNGNVAVTTFNYYDPAGNDVYSLPGTYGLSWSADPFVPVSSERLNPRIWDPPSVETEYKLTVSYLSCEADNSITESPVTTSARFTIDPIEGEAPLDVSFNAGSSLNAGEYRWYFDYNPGAAGITVPDDFSVDPEHTYYIPGQYNVLLRTISPFLCEDSLLYPDPVKVYPSELEVPNVFTPDGDGFNEVFSVRAVSLRQFSGVIYNRYGRKMFEWTDPSEAWDGKAAGDNLASPGIYYYIIKGVGWDDVKYEFTGPLYLYRTR